MRLVRGDERLQLTMRRIFVDMQSGPARELARGPYAWLVFAPGVALVALGLLIYAMPQILIALVSGALIAAGALFLLVAWRLRRAAR